MPQKLQLLSGDFLKLYTFCKMSRDWVILMQSSLQQFYFQIQFIFHLSQLISFFCIELRPQK